MIHVIVTPQKEDFKKTVLHGDAVLINKSLGRPNLEGHNAKYLAPCWLSDDMSGVSRIYHILAMNEYDEAYEIELGNSFVVDNWDEMGSHRKYEYHKLSSFGMKEVKDGLLEKI